MKTLRGRIRFVFIRAGRMGSPELSPVLAAEWVNLLHPPMADRYSVETITAAFRALGRRGEIAFVRSGETAGWDLWNVSDETQMKCLLLVEQKRSRQAEMNTQARAAIDRREK